MLFFNLLLPISIPSLFLNSSDCSQHTSLTSDYLTPISSPTSIQSTFLSTKSKSYSLLSTQSENDIKTKLPTAFFHTLTKTLQPQPTQETHIKTNTIYSKSTMKPIESTYTESTFTSTETKKSTPTNSINYQQNNQNYINTIATYYFRIGDNNIEGCAPVQNFNDGNSYGPCNNYQGVKYTSDSKYWVAIGNAQQHCGKNIEVVYNGKAMTFQVMDNCPACVADNHVDMGLEALIELTGSKENACAISKSLPNISWRFV